MSGGTTLDADNSLTVSGTLTHTGDITIDVLDNKTLSYSGAPLSLGSHTLSILGAGTLSNVSGSPLVLDQTVSILDLKGSGTVSGAVKLESGTLKSSGSATISGVLTQYSDATIEVPASQTLSYSGASLSLGANTLRISGGGAFSNTNSLVLDDPDSKLHLSSITVGSVSTSVDNSLGVVVDNDSTISNFAVSNITPVSIASGKTLEGSIGVTAGSIKLTETGSLASAVSMSGGILDADNSLTFSGALTQSGDITIDVAGESTLTYLGPSISLGPNTLILSGGGTFTNTNPLELDQGQSQLNLSGIIASYIRTKSNNLGITVDNSSTVTEFSVGHVTPVSISPNQSFNGFINVYQNSNLQLNNTGTLAADVTISGLGGTVEAQKSMTFSGSLQQVDQHEGFELIIASGETMTYSGS
ncbi:MAG: hypothetical protein P8L36_04470, partial [SAR324 cluster bacterium]|nr:hypothetical protein [SAR324 cluster bacterium]